MKQIRLLTLLLILPFLSLAQEKWEGGLLLGASNYLGDMTDPTWTATEAGPAFGILLRSHLSARFGLRANLLYSKIKGADENFRDLNEIGRDASFKNDLVEISLMGEYELLGNKRYPTGGGFKKTVSPYLFAGIGVALGEADVTVTPASLAETEGTHFGIPLGAGIRFDLSRRVNLGLEYGTRLLFTDKLDGIVADDNDVYNIGAVVLGFRFGNKDTDRDGVSDEDDACPTQAGPVALGGCPDTDGDNIADKDDACPNDAGDARMNGCPDRDADGVADNTDDCPDEAGLRRFAGCPDTDGDNIVDKEDNCPTVAGIPAMNGCPDSDRDGITDDKDACPQEAGTAEHGGCPDTDNDGIANKDDKCPTTAGTRQYMGCPDTDGDGLEDPKDKCPNLAGPVANEGCPEIKPEDKKVLDYAMKNVQFEFGSARLTKASLSILNQVAEVLSRYPGYKLHMDGYTDSVGNDFANQQLSEKRAQACYDYLASKGVAKANMTFKGHGESSPIATNDNAAGRKQNRRVEFNLKPQ